MNEKSLLVVVNDLDYLHSHRVLIIEKALASHFSVHIAAPQGARVEQFEQMGCAFHPIKIDRKGMNPLFDLKLIVDLWKLQFGIKPDVNFFITIKPYLYGGISARFLPKKPLIYVVAGMGTVLAIKSSLKRRILSYLYRLSFNQSKVDVVIQNAEDLTHLKRLGCQIEGSQVHRFFGAGVNLDDFLFTEAINSEKVRFLFASRLLNAKGINEFLLSAEILSKKMSNVEFVIAGGIDTNNIDAFSQEQKKQWQNKNLPIQFLGKLDQTELIEQYQKSDVFVFPSYYGEGIPKVLLEASAIGRPCVTTDHPGCRDVIKEAGSGLLVKPKSVQSLVNALELLAEDREKRIEFGKKARSWIEKNSDAHVIASHHVKIFEGKIK